MKVTGQSDYTVYNQQVLEDWADTTDSPPSPEILSMCSFVIINILYLFSKE